MSKFYAKELPESPVYVMGHPMMFDFLETSDATLIAELNKCVARGVGGVTEIDPDTYAAEIKKKELGKLSGNSSKQPHRRVEISAALLGHPGAAVVGSFARRQQPEAPGPVPAGTLPDPITVPEAASFILPPTAKVNQKSEKRPPEGGSPVAAVTK